MWGVIAVESLKEFIVVNVFALGIAVADFEQHVFAMLVGTDINEDRTIGITVFIGIIQ